TWTLRSMIQTDIFCRAVPWTHLILESKNAPNDLNLKVEQRLSVVLLILACLLLLLAPFCHGLLGLSASAFAGVLLLNRDLYAFFFRWGGFFFGVASVSLHFLYYLYSALTFICVWFYVQLRGAASSQPKAER